MMLHCQPPTLETNVIKIRCSETIIFKPSSPSAAFIVLNDSVLYRHSQVKRRANPLHYFRQKLQICEIKMYSCVQDVVNPPSPINDLSESVLHSAV